MNPAWKNCCEFFIFKCLVDYKHSNLVNGVVWVFVSTQNSSVEILIPKVMIFDRGVFGTCLSIEAGVPMSAVHSHKRDPAELPSPFQHEKTQKNGAFYKTGSGVSLTRCWIFQHHDIGLTASRIVGNKVLSFINYLVYEIFALVAWMDSQWL